MTRKAFIFLLCLLLLVGCGRRGGFQPQTFPMVHVPGLYAGDPDGAKEYAMMHFWDGLTDTARTFPCDSSLVSGVLRTDVEKNFSKFIMLLDMADIKVAQNAMRTMFRKAAAAYGKDSSSNVLAALVEFSERYLYDPNSPLRNEDLYGALAEMMADYEGFPKEKREVYRYDATMCSLNRTGTRAADFVFCDARGREERLYGIRAEYTLLFFSNPGCTACKEIIDVLTQDEKIARMILDGRLAVVNVYIDEDLEAWYDYMRVYPSAWHNGYDPYGIIRADTLYNVRAIPSLYLLDRDKTVLMKDAVQEKVFEYLKNI